MSIDIINKITLKIGSTDGIRSSMIPEIVRPFTEVFDKPLKHSVLTGVDFLQIIRLEDGA